MTKGSAQSGPYYSEKVIYDIVLVKKTIVWFSDFELISANDQLTAN